MTLVIIMVTLVDNEDIKCSAYDYVGTVNFDDKLVDQETFCIHFT